MYEYNNTVMVADFRERIVDELLVQRGFSREDLFLVGLSGGPDSLCLFDVLVNSGLNVSAAHFDHQLRGSSSRDAAQVQEWVQEYGKPYISGEADVAVFATANKMSIEEAARHLRYTFLFNTAEQIGAKAVLAGHHAGDQVETILMHFLRGAGLQGLRGMQSISRLPVFSNTIPLVRPLLEVKRSEILGYCEAQGLKPLGDETNQDTSLYRNRLRLELIPYLETYNPQVREALMRSSQVLDGEYEIVEMAVQEAYEACVIRVSTHWALISRPGFLGLHRALQRGLVRKLFAGLLPDLRNLSFHHTEKVILSVITPTVSGAVELVGGIRLLVEDDAFWLHNASSDLPTGQWPQIEPDSRILIQGPGRYALMDGWNLVVERSHNISLREKHVESGDASTDSVSVDADTVEFPLTLQTRTLGQRFSPLGLDGKSQKVSDLMVNEKVPARARVGWPLVLSSDKVVWVVGLRLAHEFRVTDTTVKVLRMAVVKD